MCWTRSTTMADRWKSKFNLSKGSSPTTGTFMIFADTSFGRTSLTDWKKCSPEPSLCATRAATSQKSRWTSSKTTGCHRWILTGSPWEVHHEEAPWVPGLAQDAATEREVLVCDHRWRESFVPTLMIFSRQSCWLCLPCGLVRPWWGLVSSLILNNVESLLTVRKDLFDIVIFFARKPSFFIDRRPFWKLEAEKEVTCVDKLVTGVPIGSATFC